MEMKRLLCSLGAGAFVLAGAAAVHAASSVVGSKHDMNIVSNDDAQERVCAFCHTPHHALDDAAADYNPLWSHTFTSQVFSSYVSTTEQNTGTDATVLMGPSRLCMSCHDGAIAVDQHYNFPGSDFRSGDSWNEIGVGAGGDLTNDHPIGFNFGAVGGTGSNPPPSFGAVGNGLDPEIRGLATPLRGTTPGGAAGLTLEDLMWPNGGGQFIMTCASCHDVHNTYGYTQTNAGAPGERYFLYDSQTNSAICTMCHAK